MTNSAWHLVAPNTIALTTTYGRVFKALRVGPGGWEFSYDGIHWEEALPGTVPAVERQAMAKLNKGDTWYLC